jgi:hypothetical protein
MGFLSPVTRLFSSIYIFSWDTVLVFGNLVFPNRPPGQIVPEGHPGFGGKWPEHIPANEGDSRCSCPALNAMANHGIVSHDGRDLSFVELTQKLEATYNLAPTFCVYLGKYIANYLKKDFSKDVFNLKDIDMHNQIEHDGSLLREDIHFEPDTSKIATPLIEELLGSASGKDEEGMTVLTYSDLSKALSQRQADAKANNPDFSTSLTLRNFAYGNCAAMQTVFGGKVDHLRPFLLEERIPDGWLPWNTTYFGQTLGTFNKASLKIGIHTKTVPPSRPASLAH